MPPVLLARLTPVPEVVLTASALEKVTVPPVWSVMLIAVAVVLLNVLVVPRT